MHASRLRPAADASAGAWLAPRLRRFGSGVAAVVPDGFEAYARILHPADSDQRPTRWDAVAAQTGRVAHRLMQFHAVSRPALGRSERHQWDGQEPRPGELPPDLLAALCEVLARHTTTPATCSFCVWEGYAWVNARPGSIAVTQASPLGERADNPQPAPTLRDRPLAPLEGPRFHLPSRDYVLLCGPLEAAVDMGSRVAFFVPQSPNLFWPDDLVGGSAALVEDVLAHPALEAWTAEPDDPVSYDSDHINR